MMNIKTKLVNLILMMALCSIALDSFANYDSSEGERRRTEVVKQYLADLKKADYKHIATLFTKDGIVISTSKGNVNAKEFFYTILPNFIRANVVLKQEFDNVNTQRHAVRFHLDYELKDGEKAGGEYMDEFVFDDSSTQLKAVYMFENLKFDETN